MKEIKRYEADQFVDVGGYTFIEINEESEGDLVYYTDHKSVVDELKKEASHYKNKYEAE